MAQPKLSPVSIIRMKKRQMVDRIKDCALREFQQLNKEGRMTTAQMNLYHGKLSELLENIVRNETD